ncbi:MULTISPECIES: DsrE family protein [unclassified Hydrogenobaculum]|jgi:Uncharacterized protein conserved in archaea|uniref:DsrE family protein n=1 Tax=unclassified Hydrogenobaculum TaxID=2622382 RepID=UPI0001C51EA1|nr:MULTISPECIES: DsrE family protein [unclassified Hydrogenobaculum]AEF19449.1 DsrE family protein [Hydrogenobaculum sp. 3684]AEG46738.1 hypothetical protein HydSHO_1063 [Hydrogenobaculum sp. SHO]AGG15382.1 hypothetical protein HydHO_1067 [Hydrogenobaculum sp. HO]AGH93684.1 hypothetical protein HydSN_1094 [Hydrogenobaculum sp. SN]
MKKLAIVLMSDVNISELRVEMSMRFALRASEDPSFDVRFFFWADGVKVPRQIENIPHLKDLFYKLLEKGVTTMACINNSTKLGEKDYNEQKGINVLAIGPELLELIDQGAEVITF